MTFCLFSGLIMDFFKSEKRGSRRGHLFLISVERICLQKDQAYTEYTVHILLLGWNPW